jgi:hypothetical protein
MVGSFGLGERFNEEANHSGLQSPLDIEADLQPAPSTSWMNWSISDGDKLSAEFMLTVMNGRPMKAVDRKL